MFEAEKQTFSRPYPHLGILDKLIQFLANFDSLGYWCSMKSHWFISLSKHKGRIDLAYFWNIENYLPFELNRTAMFLLRCHG